MKIVMFYELAPDGMQKAIENFPAHRARLDEFYKRGVLLMAGAFANPKEGAMGIFTDRQSAEEFIKDDPFVTSGAVGKWRLVEWNEALQ